MKMRKKILFNQPTLPFEEWSAEGAERLSHSRQDEKESSGGSVGGFGRAGYTDLDLENRDLLLNSAPERHLHYISFGSGSSGNSCYIGTSKGGILVDAGLKAEDVERTLNANGVSMNMVKGLLLTHDHSDHVRYSYNILRQHRHIRLFCTPRVLNGLLRRHSISKRIKEYHVPIFKEIPFKILDFEITAFDVPHDGTDNMGFSIDFHDKHFVLATDLGEVQERARYYMQRANYLVIEANYDLDMLRYGKYPEYLKARIQTERGHMQNEATAAFLKEIINPELRYIFLCHLSQDNNTPAKALKAVRAALEEAGKNVGNAEESILDRKADVQLMALPRFEPTRWFVFR